MQFVRIESDTAVDLVLQFCDFLQGISFHKDTVKRALQEVSEKYEADKKT